MGQLELHLTVQATKEVDGLEMGVLSDGTAYLSQKALSRLCGVASSSLTDLTNDWTSGKRTTRLAKWLTLQRFPRENIYTKTEIPGVAGNVTYAYQEDVCNLILEYYAFESPNPTEAAQANYRKLSRAGLRFYVYSSIGYNPTRAIEESWRNFHDRIKLNNAPPGYFTVFGEIYGIILAALKGGLTLDHHTIPDASVGKLWANHWNDSNLESKFGSRRDYPHFWPDYYPQSAVNPVEAKAYPDAVLPEFRRWLHEEYLPQRFPKYLGTKVSSKAISGSDARALLNQIAAEATPKKLKPIGD